MPTPAKANRYFVAYLNQGKSERTPDRETLKEAKVTAQLLKFQGATRVRVRKQ